MIRINLLPVKAVQKKEALKGQLFVLLMSVVVVVAVCYAFHSSLLSSIEAENAEIKRKEAEIARLKKITGEVNRFKKLQQELQAKLDVLEKLKAGKTGPVHLLDELSAVMSDKLWISSFSEAGGNVSLQGVGFNEATVADFLRDLESSQYYRNVELKVISQVTQGGVKMQKFDVRCQTETPPRK